MQAGPVEPIGFDSYEQAKQFEARAVAGGEVHQVLARRALSLLQFKGMERVLDLATGTGRLGLELASHLVRGVVIGVDSGYGMLQLGKEKKVTRAVHNYHVAMGKVEVLPFLEASFDAVCCSFSLHHFGQPLQAMREGVRVLRPQGRLLLFDPVLREADDPMDEELHRVINRVFQRSHGPQFAFFTLSGLGEVLAAAGLRAHTTESLAFSFDQQGLTGVPMARHWLEVARALKGQAALQARFERDYLQFSDDGLEGHVRGTLTVAMVIGAKV